MAECEVCLEENLHEKILKCGHQFCQMCLERLKRKDDITNVYVITCPNCRSSTVLQEGKVENLHTKFHTKLTCEECSKERPLTEQWWCEECSLLICGNCAMLQHRQHDCHLFQESVLEVYSTHLNDIIMEQEIVEKQIDDLCEEIKKDMLYVFRRARLQILAIKAARPPCSKKVPQKKITVGPNMEKKISLFNQVLNSLSYEHQTLDINTLKGLLEWEIKSPHFVDQICENFKSIKIFKSVSIQRLTMVRKISINCCYNPFDRLILVPNIALCVLDDAGVSMLSFENGEILYNKRWEDFGISNPFANIYCVTYSEILNCLLISCISGDASVCLVLDVPSLRLLLEFNLPDKFLFINLPAFVGFTEKGNLIIAASDGKTSFFGFNVLTRTDDKITIHEYDGNVEKIPVKLEKFTDLLMGSETQYGQAIYIIGTSVVYKFMFRKQSVALHQIINIKANPLLGQQLLYWNSSICVFNSNTRKLVCLDNEKGDMFLLDLEKPIEILAKTIFGYNNSVFVLNYMDFHLYEYIISADSDSDSESDRLSCESV